MKQNIKKGFTLAEVLIALVIIGIIAAVTVPTLMANYRKKEVSSRLKKFYSTLSNAVRLADFDNPSFLKTTVSSRYSDYENWWRENLGKYMPVEAKDNTTYKVFSLTDASGYTPSKLYILNDGSMFFPPHSGGDNSIEFLFDINGEKKPNTMGKDIFRFEVRDLRSNLYTGIDKKLWVCAGTFCLSGSANRESLKRYCSVGDGECCTRLIELDGWEVKDDYPLL